MMRRDENRQLAIVALVFIAYVVSFAWSVAIPDTSRDVFIAYEIRHGLFYPLEGPVLGVPSAIHLGPFWYYLVSLPLWVSDSWIAVVLFEGVLCGLKFPLAYFCGRRILGARFGFLWAAALALPGWTTLESLIPFNASAIESACLLVFAAYLRCLDRPDSRSAVLLLGLALGVAMHVHPTTAPVGLFAVHVLYRRWKSGEAIVSQAGLLLLGATVLLVPYVVSQVQTGWPDWQSAQGYVASQFPLGRLDLSLMLLAGQIYSGPQFVASELARWPDVLSVALAALCAALVFVAYVLSFAFMNAQRLRWLGAFSAAALLLLPWILLLRPTTPFYFAYTLAPVIAGIVAFGLDAALSRLRVTGAELVPGALFILLGAAVVVGMSANVAQGGSAVSSMVLDIKAPRSAPTFADVWFPAWDRASLGRTLCADAGPVSLHGVLAYVEDRSVGVDALFACDRVSHISLGGAGSGKHLVGLTLRQWERAGASPKCAIGPLGIVETPGPFWPSEGQRIADGNRYFPRTVSMKPDTESVIRFTTTEPGIVVVSNFLYGYERLGAVSATAEGHEIVPLFSDEFSRAYAVKPARIEWEFRARASSQEAIDIAFVPTAAIARSRGC